MKPSASCIPRSRSCFVRLRALAGPPFQTDDPEPIDYKNYEFYTFASSDGTRLETDTAGPAVEFNWGALPNVHLHIIVPAAAIFPSNNPASPRSAPVRAPSAWAISKPGSNTALCRRASTVPMIGTFTMFELPTGNAARGLGVGKTWYKVPLWVQKSFGPWTTYGGGGETLFSARVPGYRNYPVRGLAGAARLRQEVDAGRPKSSITGRKGMATPQTRPPRCWISAVTTNSAIPVFNCCSATATPSSGQRENYAYLGLYWTWGKKAGDADRRRRAEPATTGPARAVRDIFSACRERDS